MKALLVDLDDTLLDYTGGVDESWLEACSTVAVPAGVELESLVAAIARARRWLWSDPERHRRERIDMPGAWRKIAERALVEIGAPDALAPDIAGDFAARRWARMALFPGVPEALHRIRQHGVSLALVTNGDRTQQRRKVEQHDLARFFDVILIEGEFGTGKPDESVYRHVLDTLGARPSEAWMVGDNLEWDVAAPQRLGLRGAWVDAQGQGLPVTAPDRPDLIIRAFTEIVAVVDGTENGTGGPRTTPSGRGRLKDKTRPVQDSGMATKRGHVHVRTTQGVGKNGPMTTWFCKHLGDGMMADEPVEQLREAYRSLLTEGGKPTDMAVFTRHESEGRLHCDVVAYFSPAAADLARAFDADPCEKPARAGLSLLAGDQQCWPVLFPEGR